MERLEEELKEIKKKLDAIVAAVIGDPIDPSRPGMLLRLDRLEQSNLQKNKIFWLLASGVAAAIGTATLQWFR
jgi:hypothetical protein